MKAKPRRKISDWVHWAEPKIARGVKCLRVSFREWKSAYRAFTGHCWIDERYKGFTHLIILGIPLVHSKEAEDYINANS